jgi:hypothetical protein
VKKILSPPYPFGRALGSTQPPAQWYQGSFPEKERPVSGVDQHAKAQTGQSYTSISPCAFKACYRDNSHDSVTANSAESLRFNNNGLVLLYNFQFSERIKNSIKQYVDCRDAV